jgi:hypothetical protein
MIQACYSRDVQVCVNVHHQLATGIFDCRLEQQKETQAILNQWWSELDGSKEDIQMSRSAPFLVFYGATRIKKLAM